MPRIVKAFVVVALTGLFAAGQAAAPAPVQAAMTDDGRKIIESMSQAVIANLKSQNTPRAEREKLFNSLLDTHFDIPTIGRWVMGRAWRTATPAQRKTYLELFHRYVLKTYTKQLSTYAGENFKVTGAAADGPGVVVYSQIVSPNPAEKPIDIKWRMRKVNGKLKVRDVVIENISMSLNQRREFASVYSRTGSVDGLIKAIRDKLAELERGA